MADEVREIPTRLEYRLEQLKKALNPIEQPIRTHALVGVTALCVGFGVGYIFGKQRKYEAEAEIDVEVDLHDDPNQMKIKFDSDDLVDILESYKHPEETLGNDVVVEDQDELIEEVRPAVEQFVAERLKEAMTTSHEESDSEEELVVAQSVFANDDDDWDYEEEKKNRSSSAPYILHKDEFYADELNYQQTTLTYYAGDQIMTDQEDVPIYNYEYVTGPLKFGHGSGDPSVVHVRNDKRRAEYEILLHEGMYTVEVLGIEIEDNQRKRDLKHSDNRKFRLTE